MPIPLWGTLLALSLAKKATIIVIAKVYGIPKLYRRTQKGARLLLQHPETRKLWSRRIGAAFRLPDRMIDMVRGMSPLSPSAAKPSSPGWATSLARSMQATPTTSGLALLAHQQQQQMARSQRAAAATTRLRFLASSFQRRLKAASQRVRTSSAAFSLPPRPLTPTLFASQAHPLGSFASQPLLGGSAAGTLRSSSGVQQLLLTRAKSLRQSVADARLSVAARGRDYLQRAAVRRRERKERYLQRGLLGAL